MLTLLLLSPVFADDRFPLDESENMVSMGDLLRTGLVTGRTGRLIVATEDPSAIAALPEVAAVEPMRGRMIKVFPARGVDDLALARALHARRDVAWVNPDLILPIHPFSVPNDPLLADEWHIENTGQGGRTAGVDTNAETAWNYATGKGITIAILDSGVQLDHPDLRVTPGHDYVEKDEDPSPGSEWSAAHGTACSGVAAGVGNNAYGVAGIAWDADIYAIRIIGGSTTLSDTVDAFTEAVDAGASVISNSWGYSEDCTPIPKYRAFTEMFDYAETVGRGGLGSVVTFAAGNGGCDITGDGMLSHESILVIAAVESTDQRAGYSDYGEPIDLSAPTSILTTDMSTGGFGSYQGDDAMADGFNGTSAATPVVSGVVALMLEANPRLTAAQVRQVLCDTAVRGDAVRAGYDSDGWSPYYGCGRVDAGAAVAAVYNRAPLAPVPVSPQDTVWDGRAMLAWEAALDEDQDVIDYEVQWDGGEGPVTQTVTGTHLDLGESLQVGDTVEWQVRARDPWGYSDWSEARIFTVEALPKAPKVRKTEDPGGCAVVEGGGWIAVMVGARALRRRR